MIVLLGAVGLVPIDASQLQYVVSSSRNDSDGIAYLPSNDYDLSGEWGRASFARRQPLLLLGRPTPGRGFDVGVNLNLQSGAPYTEVLSGDPLNNGRGNARPLGVVRNGLEGAAQAVLDVRMSRDVPVLKASAQGRERMTVHARAGYRAIPGS